MFRILAMDGSSWSGGLGYIAAGMLQRMKVLVQRQPGKTLLNNVHVFAGTSGGAWNALFFAKHADPDDALNDVLDFWQMTVDRMPAVDKRTVSPLRELSAFTGGSAVVNTRLVRDFFIDYFGRKTKLGDLKHKVVIPAFQLDNQNPRRRRWKAKIFNNMHPNDPDLEQLVVDVAMRTSSPPVIDPIFQSITYKGPGYIDGGVFANDPALIALAQVLHELERDHDEANMSDIRLMSLGNGQSIRYVAPKFKNGMADWGFRRWLVDPFNAFALVDLLMQANMMSTSYQCRCFLRKGYIRVDPEAASGGEAR